MREVLEETGLALSEPTFLSCTNRIFDEKSGKRHYVSIYMKGSVERSSEPQVRGVHARQIAATLVRDKLTLGFYSLWSLISAKDGSG